MKRIHVLAVILIALITAPPCHATLITAEQQKTFTTDGVIQEGDVYETVSVYDTPPAHTTLNMTGGTVGDYYDTESGLYAYDASQINISGGEVLHLHTTDSSEVNITGGAVGAGHALFSYTESHETSIINVCEGGSFVGGSLTQLILFDSSILNVFGGRVDALVGLGDSSTINIFSGHALHIGTSADSIGVVSVYGGTIDSFRTNTYIADTATVNIYGCDVVYDANGQWIQPPDKDGWWMSKLTGIGLDGEEITWWGLPDPATHPNINIIPEPSSSMLWMLGALGLLQTKSQAERKER